MFLYWLLTLLGGAGLGSLGTILVQEFRAAGRVIADVQREVNAARKQTSQPTRLFVATSALPLIDDVATMQAPEFAEPTVTLGDTDLTQGWRWTEVGWAPAGFTFQPAPPDPPAPVYATGLLPQMHTFTVTVEAGMARGLADLMSPERADWLTKHPHELISGPEGSYVAAPAPEPTAYVIPCIGTSWCQAQTHFPGLPGWEGYCHALVKQWGESTWEHWDRVRRNYDAWWYQRRSIPAVPTPDPVPAVAQESVPVPVDYATVAMCDSTYTCDAALHTPHCLAASWELELAHHLDAIERAGLHAVEQQRLAAP